MAQSTSNVGYTQNAGGGQTFTGGSTPQTGQTLAQYIQANNPSLMPFFTAIANYAGQNPNNSYSQDVSGFNTPAFNTYRPGNVNTTSVAGLGGGGGTATPRSSAHMGKQTASNPQQLANQGAMGPQLLAQLLGIGGGAGAGTGAANTGTPPSTYSMPTAANNGVATGAGLGTGAGAGAGAGGAIQQLLKNPQIMQAIMHMLKQRGMGGGAMTPQVGGGMV